MYRDRASIGKILTDYPEHVIFVRINNTDQKVIADRDDLGNIHETVVIYQVEEQSIFINNDD